MKPSARQLFRAIGYWKLGGNHRGAASVAFLEDFQKIVTGGGVERLQAPVIENEQIGAAQVAQKTRMASVGSLSRSSGEVWPPSSFQRITAQRDDPA